MSNYTGFNWPDLDFGDVNPQQEHFSPVVITNAGLNSINFIVPGDNAWRIASIRHDYTTNATVGNRMFSLLYQEDPSTDFFAVAQSLVQPAGGTKEYVYSTAFSQVVNTTLQGMAPLLDVVLLPMTRITLRVTGADVGDIFGPFDMYRLEISTTPTGKNRIELPTATPVLL